MDKRTSAVISGKKMKVPAIMNALSERIILQALEDLWDADERKESVEFFRGEGFTLCAEMANINLFDQVSLLKLVNDVVRREQKKTRVSTKNRCQNIKAQSTVLA